MHMCFVLQIFAGDNDKVNKRNFTFDCNKKKVAYKEVNNIHRYHHQEPCKEIFLKSSLFI